MQGAVPFTRDLVLVGGGHTHALVLRRWGMNPLPGARLTLVNPGPTAPYTGMLPGHVAGHYRREELDIDLVRLARFAGARLVFGLATGLDRDRRRLRIEGRPDIAYDVLSFDIGITSDLPEIEGFAEFGLPAKPLGRFASAWEEFVAGVEAGRTKPEIAVLGAGIGGVELALAMHHRLRNTPGLTLSLVEAETALTGRSVKAREALIETLKARNIGLHERRSTVRVTADAIHLDDGTALPSRFTISAAGARPHAWLGETGLDLTEGYLNVGPDLRCVGADDVFAVGDCAHMTDTPRPKAGVFAVRQAPVLFANLRAALSGGRLRRFRPQSDYLKLVSLGERAALGEKLGRTAQGPWVWRLKDRIDRRFMTQFEALRPMAGPPIPNVAATGLVEALSGGQPPCAGCGAKVGPDVLEATLDGPGDDAAIREVGGVTQILTTDHLRAITDDPWRFARIAAHHALGDIWAMGAAPEAALLNITLPHMSEPLQRETLREIMAGLAQVLGKAGAGIIGGHTTLGAEFSLGITLTGRAGKVPVTLAGARPGDVLILTKPIGSGTILAAEMALKARGAWVAACLDAMDQDQGPAARILAGAHAMTDVTGFGLAGHLLNMCRTSGVAARLDLPAIPTLDGADALARDGIRSTLYPRNLAAAERRIDGQADAAPLLFDPQTSGGLLAAVPARGAPARLKRLAEAGFAAAIIGKIETGAPTLRLDP